MCGPLATIDLQQTPLSQSQLSRHPLSIATAVLIYLSTVAGHPHVRSPVRPSFRAGPPSVCPAARPLACPAARLSSHRYLFAIVCPYASCPSGRCHHRLYSYGLHIYGLHIYGLYSYGLPSYVLYSLWPVWLLPIRSTPTSPSFCNKCDAYLCRCDEAADTALAAQGSLLHRP